MDGKKIVSYKMIWVKLFKNEPSKNCGRQPLKNLKWYGLPKQTIDIIDIPDKVFLFNLNKQRNKKSPKFKNNYFSKLSKY